MFRVLRNVDSDNEDDGRPNELMKFIWPSSHARARSDFIKPDRY